MAGGPDFGNVWSPGSAGGWTRNGDRLHPALLLGYARCDLYLSDRHVDDLKRELGEFGQLEGFLMGSMYVEDPETAPQAFEALVASVNRYEITAVVLPSLRHLPLVGDPAEVRGQFERVTGARIMLHEVAP
ncbi:hypothetical protein ABZX12_35960 [Kribbella sp. NPDC003505]|uniref:hypothetical protein n=1 Tax=Kribbella sp. NPDC003505 TaxID=3154448 RepID=UPI00339E2A5C